jgi:hypothetical protein
MESTAGRGVPAGTSGRLLLVRLSSERARQAVRRDSSFAKKQEPPPALLVVVHSDGLVALHRDVDPRL